MSYTYFDHEADLGIIAEGRTLEEAFEEGAQAMLDAICEHQGKKEEEFSIRLNAQDLESLWIDFLNELLAQMDIQEIFLSSCKVKKINMNKGVCNLEGKAYGFPRSNRVTRKSEIKAATYCQVKVIQKINACKVRCVLDL
jgi:SHS2 domain-containing protein